MWRAATTCPTTPAAIGRTPAAARAAGNFVLQQLMDGRVVVYAGLKRGSVRVKAGQRVTTAGDVRVGNSADSARPRLELRVMDGRGGPSTLGAEGLPFVVRRFALEGRLTRGSGRAARVVVSARAREGQLPLTGDIVASR